MHSPEAALVFLDVGAENMSGDLHSRPRAAGLSLASASDYGSLPHCLILPEGMLDAGSESVNPCRRLVLSCGKSQPFI